LNRQHNTCHCHRHPSNGGGIAQHENYEGRDYQINSIYFFVEKDTFQQKKLSCAKQRKEKPKMAKQSDTKNGDR
jgi:hypothetical protein